MTKIRHLYVGSKWHFRQHSKILKNKIHIIIIQPVTAHLSHFWRVSFWASTFYLETINTIDKKRKRGKGIQCCELRHGSLINWINISHFTDIDSPTKLSTYFSLFFKAFIKHTSMCVSELSLPLKGFIKHTTV